MPTQLIAGLQGPLQVDAPAGAPLVERGPGQRLVGDIDSEDAAAAGLGADRGDREASAVAGDGGAERDALRRIAAADGEASPIPRHHGAEVTDDAREHARRLSRGPLSPKPRPARLVAADRTMLR